MAEYKDVEPRYMWPKSKPPEEPAPSPKQFTISTKYATTEARYLSPREKPSPPPLPDMSKPTAHWEDARQHHRVARSMGFGSTDSKWMESALRRTPDPQNSPRRQVEEKKAEARKYNPKPWNSAGAFAKTNAFDDTLEEYYAVHKELQPGTGNQPKVAQRAHSVVGEYIRNGTPIRNAESPARTPTRKTKSPAPFHSPGLGHSDFSSLESQSKKRPAYASEERRVATERKERTEKKVAKNHTPRVAKMTPAYQLAHVEEGSPSINNSRQNSPSSPATDRKSGAYHSASPRMRPPPAMTN